MKHRSERRGGREREKRERRREKGNRQRWREERESEPIPPDLLNLT